MLVVGLGALVFLNRVLEEGPCQEGTVTAIL